VAYHTWYSSRALIAKDILDGYDVKYLLDRRKKILELFKRVLGI